MLSAAPDPSARHQACLEALALQISRHTEDGVAHWPAHLPGLALFCTHSLAGPVCGMYEPSVALIVRGRKQVMLGGDTLVYGSGDCLLTSLDLPIVAQILEASPARPHLALMLTLDLHEVAGLMLDAPLPVATAPGPAMAVGPAGLPLLQAFERLLGLLDTPQDSPVMAPLLRREILYRLLTGPQGTRLRQIASVGSQGQQVARAIAWLRSHYAEPLRVAELAALVRMSASTFHHHFRLLTAMSPLQYQKSLRLNEARRLMLAEHLDAAAAAYRVGYESASQFSREYSRHFGAPPMRDIAGLRTQPDAVAATA